MTNYQLGELYYLEQEYEEALFHYKKALEEFPESGKILYQIGYTYQQLKNYSKACEYYEEVYF
jgi:Uncharacterized protein conserved in bacteria